MPRETVDEETVVWLGSHPGGVTLWQMAAHFGIGREAARLRVRNARRWLEVNPEIGLTIPRATREEGWLFRVTNRFRDVGPDIAKGQIDDNVNLLGMLRRMLVEAQVAYDKYVADEGKRSKAAKGQLKRCGHLEAVIDMIEGDLGGLVTIV